MSDGGVIDWEKLKNLLTRLRHQVYHTLEVAEVTDARTSLASKRENRHQGSR